MRLIAISGLVALSFIFTSCGFKTEPHLETLNNHIAFETYAEEVMRNEAVPGMAVAVINNGEIISLKAYGFADVDKRRQMTVDTPMNIASISKPILGIGVLQLVDQGLLNLDEDINAYLPFIVDNPSTEGERITLRNIASHTSGIADFYDESDLTSGADSPIHLTEYLRELITPTGARYEKGAHYLKVMPGAAREYSNLAASVAGAVVEEISGQSLHEYTSANIFEPLGMDQSTWSINANKPDVLAIRYDKDNKPYPHYGNPSYPDGGVNSSVRDLTKLTLSILNEDLHSKYNILSAPSFREMLALQLPKKISTRQRFFWRDRDGATGHMGSDLGVATSLYFNRSTGNAIIILFNSDFDSRTSDVMKKVIERARQDILEQ